MKEEGSWEISGQFEQILMPFIYGCRKRSIRFSSLRCIPCHESWRQRYIWRFEIVLATPTWSDSSSTRSRASFTSSPNWVMSSLTGTAQTVYDGRSKPNWFSYFSSAHIIFQIKSDLILFKEFNMFSFSFWLLRNKQGLIHLQTLKLTLTIQHN